jgi:hypothetical protein
VSAEGREQPVVEPQVETTPAAVAEAPDTTTPKQQTEDPTKLDISGEKPSGAARTGDPAAEEKPAAEKPKAEKKPAAEKPKRAPRKKKADT